MDAGATSEPGRTVGSRPFRASAALLPTRSLSSRSSMVAAARCDLKQAPAILVEAVRTRPPTRSSGSSSATAARDRPRPHVLRSRLETQGQHRPGRGPRARVTLALRLVRPLCVQARAPGRGADICASGARRRHRGRRTRRRARPRSSSARTPSLGPSQRLGSRSSPRPRRRPTSRGRSAWCPWPSSTCRTYARWHTRRLLRQPTLACTCAPRPPTPSASCASGRRGAITSRRALPPAAIPPSRGAPRPPGVMLCAWSGCRWPWLSFRPTNPSVHCAFGALCSALPWSAAPKERVRAGSLDPPFRPLASTLADVVRGTPPPCLTSR